MRDVLVLLGKLRSVPGLPQLWLLPVPHRVSIPLPVHHEGSLLSLCGLGCEGVFWRENRLGAKVVALWSSVGSLAAYVRVFSPLAWRRRVIELEVKFARLLRGLRCRESLEAGCRLIRVSLGEVKLYFGLLCWLLLQKIVGLWHGFLAKRNS